MILRGCSLGLIILINLSVAWADVSKIIVLGLFNGQVVLEIDNKQRILKAGKTSPEGVTLISATSRVAVLEVNGVQQQYFLGSHIGSHYASPPKQPVVSLWPTQGMYLTPGSINGYSVDFIVDTGASAIALNANTAKRLGIDYKQGKAVGVRTASRIEKAYKVNLDLVQVGEIKLHNVSAMVLDGEEPVRALLGMSFLGQLDMERRGDRMDLKQKF
jgi:aspartyl protease family protein